MTLLNNGLNDRYPNELFRFVHVRGPRRAPVDEIPTYFVQNIYDQISRNELLVIQRKNATLYPTLVTRIGSPKQLNEQMADVAAYKKSKEYIADPDHYAQHFPELTSFLSWLDASSSSAKIKAVRHRFRVATGHEVSGYVKSAEFKTLQCTLWDNLIAGLFSPNDPFLVTLACKYLAGLHLAEVISGDPECQELPHDFSSVYHAKPLVPKWVYEAFATADLKPDEGVGDQRPDRERDETLTARFNELNRALQEVRTLIAKRMETQRQELRRITSNLPPFPATELADGGERQGAELAKSSDAFKSLKSPYELTPDEQSGFSATTGQLVKQSSPEGGTLSLDTFLETLVGEAAAVATRLDSREREYCVRVADTIISRRDLCIEMIDKDPCAIYPREKFYSRGCYFNSALVGDLLVTKQQLIKYDTGEVAHVEAVMQGLEKERTHRRLNRSETTSTFERESINESEREQATTERFSMEKETAETVEEDVKSSKGVNLSAAYGVVTGGAHLDTSSGTSQAQSEQTVTSFSKDVTNRALFRVKKTVREMKTITVINEVEETSVNKLTNDTGDHINGVHCWLDKFYLNKIINYGRRMMFEFAVPEPALFYIFRKMTKPHTGAVVEMPALPSEVSAPDGNKLTSPAALSDANYQFWVAQYEVANVAAPPQEYINISSAFKNQYTITAINVQIVDSFASSILIDPGYEAIAASISSGIFNDANFHGLIGVSPFPGPTWNTYIVLPNVRASLALSLLSRGSGFVINVVVTAKRSDEFYNNWKLDTYGKIIEAYNRKKQAYDEWLNAQYADTTFGFTGNGHNPEINRATEREELKKRCLELFTGQRFESMDAAADGLQNVSGYPEILFREAVAEGNVVKFFEQAFDWENMTYIFDPYFWGRKTNWSTVKNLEDTGDPLFTKFLQAGYARVMVPANVGFENYLLMFYLWSNFAWGFGYPLNFAPSLFGALGVSNDFSPGINDPLYTSIAYELQNAAALDEETGTVIGHYVQKVPTNLVYVVPTGLPPGTPLPGLPDNTADPEIANYI